MSKFKYTEIKDHISPLEHQIYLTIDTCFYPNSLKIMLLRRFIPLYRDYIIAIEEHYQSVLTCDMSAKASNMSAKSSDLEFLLYTSKKNIEHFEKEYDKIYLDSKICC